MSVDLADDIVRDFLIEAGEILEQLGEQLITLEGHPDNRDLLNGIFRSFHTIKGGAGFLRFDAMVDVCHRVEDIFNRLRRGQRSVDPRLMDVTLKVVDLLNHMVQQIKEGKTPPTVTVMLLEELHCLAHDEIPWESASEHADVSSDIDGNPGPSVVSDRHITAPAQAAAVPDEASTAVRAGLRKESSRHVQPSGRTSAERNDDDPITDEESEALLGARHSANKAGLVPRPQPSEKIAVLSEVPAGHDPQRQEYGEAALKVPAISPIANPSHPPLDAPSVLPSTTKRSRVNREPPSPATLRVDTRALDQIMNMVGELVLIRNRLVMLQSTMADDALSKAVANLDLVTTNIQAALMRARMQPIRKVFARFSRVVRDLGRSLNKEVELTMIGEDTDLDKNLVDALAEPMIHLVRNAVDHGLELPQVREAAGKSRMGKITLAAEHEGDHILLTVSDDGAGIDAHTLRCKAIEKGLVDKDDAARLNDRDCYSLIFSPGFSTKLEVSDISGRGVGMDVVKTQIAQLNGTVEVDSTLGQGTQIHIKVPLTLAIVPTLTALLGGQIFAFPLASVEEIFNLNPGHTHYVSGELVVRVRGKSLPLYYLGKWLLRDARGLAMDRGHVVVVNVSGQRAGFVVDQLIGQEEVLIKPLGAMLHSVQGLAGAAITGNGRIALILDIPGLIGAYAHRP